MPVFDKISNTMEFISTRRKIKSPNRLKPILRRLQAGGKKVVFTNGVFDILHVGHVRLLEQSKRQGDILVVALNTDESVKRLKGPERPLNTLEKRAELMAALACVDFVTWFEEDTPLEVFVHLRPDILVKGGDYKVSEIVGAREVKSWGGRVVRIKLVEGQSTTGLLKRVKKLGTVEKK